MEQLSVGGDNSFGQCGNGQKLAVGGVFNPVEVSGITDAVAITAGSYFTCATLATGKVNCWGRHISGQIGDGTAAGGEKLTPTEVVGVDGPIQIAANSNMACAVFSDNTMKCWG